MKKENSRLNQNIIYAVRCYSCNYEFKKELRLNDNLLEEICPSCKKNTIELNLGKKLSN